MIHESWKCLWKVHNLRVKIKESVFVFRLHTYEWETCFFRVSNESRLCISSRVDLDFVLANRLPDTEISSRMECCVGDKWHIIILLREGALAHKQVLPEISLIHWTHSYELQTVFVFRFILFDFRRVFSSPIRIKQHFWFCQRKKNTCWNFPICFRTMPYFGWVLLPNFLPFWTNLKYRF